MGPSEFQLIFVTFCPEFVTFLLKKGSSSAVQIFWSPLYPFGMLSFIYLKKKVPVYRVIREERSIFWKVIVSVMVRKKFI